METIVIAGAGTMGASMALAFARFNFPVHVYDIAKTALKKGSESVDIALEGLVSADVVLQADVPSIIGNISYTTDLKVFEKADVVIESIVEKLEIKESFYRDISKLVKPECVICSNTSAIPISTMADYVEIPERFLGMHWFNPSHLIPLIEIIKGEKTGQKYVYFIYDLATRIDKQPVVINKDVKGFVANRIQFAILREALHLVENEVISAKDLDKVVQYSLGIRLASYGPLAIADFGGLDTFLHISKFLNPDLCDSHEASQLLEELVSQNKMGLKTRGGFYEYDELEANEAIKVRDMKLAEQLGS